MFSYLLNLITRPRSEHCGLHWSVLLIDLSMIRSIIGLLVRCIWRWQSVMLGWQFWYTLIASTDASFCILHQSQECFFWTHSSVPCPWSQPCTKRISFERNTVSFMLWVVLVVLPETECCNTVRAKERNLRNTESPWRKMLPSQMSLLPQGDAELVQLKIVGAIAVTVVWAHQFEEQMQC